jgi:hypothetical protein
VASAADSVPADSAAAGFTAAALAAGSMAEGAGSTAVAAIVKSHLFDLGAVA